ncbi:type IV pilin protein [Alishewanella tabrizica]|uniref:Type IV pilus biogenesis protein PilE n=1 Tax=Alishewanella tabrizica TaxID=671278 RepID=A0ABQ2WH22_9ALTE|nr:type IV pilin protein [Alishewanella tabrizica]GGW52968.1 hypothetical protein GCM10008111_06360 [Alishewanella tabrizica]
MRMQGLSLIELLVVVVLVGILSSIVYPSYQQYVLRSYRAEAMSNLLEIANRQEQRLLDAGEYSSDLTLLGIPTGFSVSGRYRFRVDLSNDNQAYTLEMRAQGPQQKDAECLQFTINQLGQRNAGLAESVSCWY